MDTLADIPVLDEFIAMCGTKLWRDRLKSLRASTSAPTRQSKQARAFHSIELLLDRTLAAPRTSVLSTPERLIIGFANDAAALHRDLAPAAQARLRDRFAAGLTGANCLVPLCHLFRTAARHRARGFDVSFAGIEDDAPFDLLIARGGAEAEIACDVMSAEEGRFVHRAAWCDLVDRIDPELRTWLPAHPGRYLLKLTFPLGLKPGPQDTSLLTALQARISALLSSHQRADADDAAVLRLDPLTLAPAQADERALMPRLRQEFGPEAHLAVTAASGGLFVMAARAARQNEVAPALRRRLAAVAPARLTGTRPGIIAMFVEDTDRFEWRLLRERLELEGEARQFLTHPEARPVVAVTCSSRLELFGIGEPDGAPDGELRFRNQAHPAAKRPELAPAISSSV